MSSNYFARIEQEIRLLQQRRTALEAENLELRTQLTNLRNGRHILLEIEGQRFSFLSTVVELSTPILAAQQTLSEQPAISGKAPAPEEDVPTSTTETTIANNEILATEDLEEEEEAEEVEKVEEEQKQEKKKPLQPTFLEEMMINEFAAAATSPMAVWTGPIKKQEAINEDQKAALRRELMGSFLLE